MTRCVLALGTNLGDREQNLASACREIAALPGCQLLARSRWHGTTPIGGTTGQGEFLNGAILIETLLPATELAHALQEIETKLGRQRVVRWDARTIDIDVLLYGNQIIDSPELTIPHPRMAFRRFVLEPAVEIAGSMMHPTSGWTLGSLLRHLQESPRLVVVTSRERRLARWLQTQLHEDCSAAKIVEEKKNVPQTGVLQPGRGIEFLHSGSGQPPVIVAQTPDGLLRCSTQSKQHYEQVRPALTMWLDVRDADKFAQSVGCTECPTEPEHADWSTSTEFEPLGLGPVCRITTDDPATVMQEAAAAIRCIWPDLL